MNDIKVSCIDSRRSAIDSFYTGTDERILNMIDDFFKRLEEFAKTCSDVSDFETKFQKSPLALEYTNLFTKVMGGQIDAKREAKEAAMYTGEEIVDDITHRAKMEARQEAYDTVRDIPVIGDAMTVKWHFDLFSRFRKKKD